MNKSSPQKRNKITTNSDFRTEKVVYVDLDGTICDYKDGFQGIEKFGPPLPDAEELLKTLNDFGFKVVIWSTRGCPDANPGYTRKQLRDLIQGWLDEYDLAKYIHDIHQEKGHIAFVIDDRARQFKGSAKEVLDSIYNNTPWWLEK